MRILTNKFKLLAAFLLILVSSGCAMMDRGATLSGANEVPPNSSTASGLSKIVIGSDRTVTGSVAYSGVTATAAHIHQGAAGTNGPVIVPFTKTTEGTFVPAPNARLTDEQYASYLAGNLYFNIHSAAYPGGEIRTQLRPKR